VAYVYSTPHNFFSREPIFAILFLFDPYTSQLSNAPLIVPKRQNLVILWSKTSTDDDFDDDISGETSTGKPNETQQFTYAQKALFKLRMMISKYFINDIVIIWFIAVLVNNQPHGVVNKLEASDNVSWQQERLCKTTTR
jgi:hypothetical protein